MDQLNIDAAPEEAVQTVSLDDPTAASPVVTPEVAQIRAEKAVKAVPAMKMSASQAYDEIANGREQQLREKAAAAIDFNKQQSISATISDWAKKKGGPLTPAEAQFATETVNSLLSPTDTYSVFEEYYSKDYLKHITETADTNPHGMIWNARAEIPEQTEQTDEKIWQSTAKRDLIRKELENSTSSYKKQGYFPWGVDQAIGMIPLRNQFRLLGVEGTDTSIFSVGLLDSLLDKQAIELLQLNYKDFVPALQNKLKSLEDDPTLKVKFMESLYGKSTSEIVLGNTFDIVDKVTAGQLASFAVKTGIKLTRAAQLYRDYNKMAKELVKASELEDRTGAIAKEALGDVEGAGVAKVANDVLAGTKGSANPVKEGVEQLPSALVSDAVEISAAPGRLGREYATRLANRTAMFGEKVVSMISDLTRIQKIPEALASRIALNDIKEEIKSLYTGIRNAIIDVRDPTHNPLSNTWHFDVVIGKPDATLFRSKEQAQQFAEAHGLVSAVAENKNAGGGWFLRVSKPLDETSDIIRDTFLKTINTKDPEGLWKLMKAAISHVGGADESLGLQHRMNRKLATYGASIVSKLAREEGKYIRDLAKGIIRKDDLYAKEVLNNRLSLAARKQRWNQWESVVKYARTMEDKGTGLPGYFAKSPGELDNIYMDVVGRVPDVVETNAYFAYKRIVEMDRMLRNVALYGKKSRQGVQQYQVHSLDALEMKYNSGFFEGKVHKGFPGGDNSILVLGDRIGDEKILDLGTLANQVVLKDAKKAVEEGHKVVLEIVNAADKPFKDFGTSARLGRPRYVIVDAKRIEEKALSWEQVPRRGGGHFEYDYDYYIKQARISTERIGARVKHWYEGDTTVMPVDIRTKGAKFAEHLDELRILIKNKDVDAARVYADAHMPLIDFDEVHSWFKWTTEKGKKIPPRLNLNEPIRLVPRDKTLADIDNTMKLRLEADGATFKDGTKGGSLSREMQMEFTQERDAHDIFSLADKGTRYKPLYAFEPAQMVDVMPSLHRAVAKMSKSIFMDDYKTFAVEHWLADASNYLKVQGDVVGSIRSMPYYYFHNPEFLPSTPKEVKYKLLNDHMKIQQLLGQTSETQKFLHATAQHLIDGSYRTFGPGRVTAVAEWTLPKITDPTDFIRGATFHSTLGLFNLPQLIVQANTFANILAFAGYQHAASGTYAAFMTQLSRINKNPEVLKKLDEFLATHNFMPGAKKWKRGEFMESLAEGDRTGFFNVSGEHTLRNADVSNQIVQSGFDKFLDAGAVFFREGERSVRFGAWHTAYREFRTQNPVGRITDKDRAWMLNRADELSVNMSRASNSILHTGIASIPMQFYTYQLRVMEQFLSNRFTWKEKARAFATYGALYGIPTATSLGGFPAGDYIRRYALENGYEAGQNVASTTFHEGLLSMMLAFITGKGNMKEGNFYNVPERYGIQGLETIREALRSDNTMLKVVTGAAGSRFGGVFGAVDPVWRWIQSFTDPEDKQYPLQDSDLVQFLKETSSGANAAERMITAVNTGNIYSKKDALLEEGVSVPNAIFQYISGLSSGKRSDMQLLRWSKDEQMAYDKKTEGMYVKEMHGGLAVGDDPLSLEHAARHFQRARQILAQRNYPEDKRAYIFGRAAEGQEPMVERMAKAFALKNVPAGQEASRLGAYLNQLQRKP